MIHKSWARLARALAIPALVASAVVIWPLSGQAGGQHSAVAWTPMSPTRVSFQQVAQQDTVTGTVLAFNDFHGNIDPPTGSGAWSTAFRPAGRSTSRTG